MRSTLLLVICHLSLFLFCQKSGEKRWSMECGASTINTFKESSILNLRCISPKFRWSDEDMTEEEEKHPEKFNKARFMVELLYNPRLHFLGTGANIQYRILKYKRLSLEAYGGLKFIIIKPTDYIINPHTASTHKDIWYINPGLICQLDLGVIAPFADVGGDGIATIGTEVNFYSIYRKIRKRYRTPYLRES